MAVPFFSICKSSLKIVDNWKTKTSKCRNSIYWCEIPKSEMGLWPIVVRILEFSINELGFGILGLWFLVHQLFLKKHCKFFSSRHLWSLILDIPIHFWHRYLQIKIKGTATSIQLATISQIWFFFMTSQGSSFWSSCIYYELS